jgi:hypothetical protein
MPDENNNPLPGEPDYTTNEVVNADGKPINPKSVSAKPTEAQIVTNPELANLPGEPNTQTGVNTATPATEADREAAVADSRGVGQTDQTEPLTQEVGDIPNPNTITEQNYTIEQQKIANVPAVPDEKAEENITIAPSPEVYKIEAADLDAYPELGQQGFTEGQEIEYNSAYVNKWATAEKLSTVRVPWPTNTNIARNGINFRG